MAFSSDIEQSAHDSEDESEAQSTRDFDNESEVHRDLSQNSELLSATNCIFRNHYLYPPSLATSPNY